MDRGKDWPKTLIQRWSLGSVLTEKWFQIETIQDVRPNLVKIKLTLCRTDEC